MFTNVQKTDNFSLKLLKEMNVFGQNFYFIDFMIGKNTGILGQIPPSCKLRPGSK